MKNLFQNKKILFTLILMASCFGILGVGGEIFAYDYRCDNNSVTYGGSTVNDGMTANDWCAGSRDDCDDENNYDYAFCVENNQKSVQFGCEKGLLWTCKCKQTLFKVDDCPNGCVNGKCQTSPTPPAATCESKEDQICCDEKDCRGVVTSDPKECSIGVCCKKEYWKCESKNNQECVDTTKCVNNVNAILSDPNYCSNSLVCVERGSCKTETITCDCKSSCTSWVTDSECGERGCKSSEKYQIRSCTWNGGCKSGDCDIKQCKYFSDCKTTTPNPCYWISFDDKGQNCKDTEKAEICGPSDCTGVCKDNGVPRTKGYIRCISKTPGGGGNNGGHYEEKPPPGGAVNFTNPLSTNSFEALVMGIINWILGIVVSLAILFLIIGGLMYITSAGDEERIKKAKNIILYAVVGLGVVILSWSIITELKDILGVQ